MRQTARRPGRPALAALAAGLALAVALAPATACTRVLGRSTSAAPRAVVTFVNQSTDQATVYAVGISGEQFRIGNVPGGRSEDLPLPASVLGAGGTVNFLARPLATPRMLQSGPVSVRPGDRFTVTLPAAANTLSVLPTP